MHILGSHILPSEFFNSRSAGPAPEPFPTGFYTTDVPFDAVKAIESDLFSVLIMFFCNIVFAFFLLQRESISMQAIRGVKNCKQTTLGCDFGSFGRGGLPSSNWQRPRAPGVGGSKRSLKRCRHHEGPTDDIFDRLYGISSVYIIYIIIDHYRVCLHHECFFFFITFGILLLYFFCVWIHFEII